MKNKKFLEPEAAPRAWWVNHKQTFHQEVGGGYLWSPKQNRNGARNVTYDNMARVQPGDLVYSYAGGHIRAIGTAVGRAQTARQPAEFGRTGQLWVKARGWRVPVKFQELVEPLKPARHMRALRDLLPEKHSPIRKNGQGNQSVYLAAIPGEMSQALLALLKHPGGAGTIDPLADLERDRQERLALRQIDHDKELTTTQRKTLVDARIGQGLFRQRLEDIEKRGCRVTGITDAQFLRASHIRPWCKSNNRQRIDGNNGLLLAPHIDHLFDRGFISFKDNGDLMVSRLCSEAVLTALGLRAPLNVGPFSPEQCVYLQYHREHCFKKGLKR